MGPVVIGIDLGGTKCHGAVADASGAVLFEARQGTDAGDAGRSLRTVWGELHAEAGRQGCAVIQTVVGVPAVIDSRSSAITRGPNVGWSEISTRELLGDVAPLAFENDANLAAVAELTAPESETRDFTLLSIGTGFGGSTVAAGRVIRGNSGGAGEFGEMPLRLFDSLSNRTPATLEDIVSGEGLRRAAEESQARSPWTFDFPLDAKGVIEAAHRGNPDADTILAPVLELLASLVVALSFISDPRAVIFDGSVGRALAPSLHRIRDIAQRCIETPPVLTASVVTPTSTVRGAIALALALGGLSDQASDSDLWGLAPERTGHSV